MTFLTKQYENRFVLYDREVFADPDLIGFTSEAWAQHDAITGFAEGRGTTFFVNYYELELALRHYHRGGLIARWSADRYLWTGLNSNRAWRELHLLQTLRERNLPVPRPVAAQVIRHGLLYTADIMTRRIPGAKAVGQLLASEELDTGHWIAMGSMIRRFHSQGVYHADLNANNILLDSGGRFYLIDFDRGVIRTPRRGWQQRNLQRLHRSLTKLQGAQDTFHFSEQNWQDLLTGYNQL
ncbi:MAG: 3-deoxy-D-manno-octulosonic acid kinase [Thiohalophilus sp.]|uniref:3-deoxy-D-manno-octulosonic acid kinase n=1 Tax=Thiohalophilus sp. TaxID=3028392 RepID=UPI00286FB0E3|nr:3-deoxy-D-manno-octulosonic acid kinase [Thiohalophilus sp.]MDR9437533.1 3-deoxy-D-manno-octulosonic acid kinase [Thiohalophilus sp.]